MTEQDKIKQNKSFSELFNAIKNNRIELTDQQKAKLDDLENHLPIDESINIFINEEFE